MRFLWHVTALLFILSICAPIILILSSVLDNILQRPKIKIPLPIVSLDLYPKSSPLLDLWNFQYIINNNVCIANNSDTITAALIITSHAGDVEGRSAIRQAYPVEELNKLGIRRVFLLALLNARKRDHQYNTVSQSALLDENEHHSDLVQGNFYEAYRNLTYKHLMGLQWAVKYCNEAQFIIKMDDDIIVDLYQLMDLIKSFDSKEELLMGYVLRGMQPVRDKSNKWFVTHSEYTKSFYPPFLSGWMYVTTPKTADKLVKASTRAPFFWIDDTYITGILSKTIGIKHKDISDKFTVHPEYLQCCLEGHRSKKLTCDFIVGPMGGDSDLLLRFQKYAAACYEHDCPKRNPKKALNKTCISKKKTPSLGKGKAKIAPYHLI